MTGNNYAEKIGKEVVVADQGRIDEFLEKVGRKHE